jgi:hypothetical protein
LLTKCQVRHALVCVRCIVLYHVRGAACCVCKHTVLALATSAYHGVVGVVGGTEVVSGFGCSRIVLLVLVLYWVESCGWVRILLQQQLPTYMRWLVIS